MTSVLYERDFYAWANEQAELLRSGQLAQADIEHIAEEIENLGRAEKRELRNLFAELLLHLLKWQFQPGRRSPSWKAAIRIKRRNLIDHMTDNPSLCAVLPQVIERAYGTAVIEAVAETGLPEITFSVTCPWLPGRVLDEDFWPEATEL